MQFPHINKLELPDECRSIVISFLRVPHPTAKMIKALQFERRGVDVYPFLGKLKLVITGPGVREYWDWVEDIPELFFSYSEVTGEPLLHWNDDRQRYDMSDDDTSDD